MWYHTCTFLLTICLKYYFSHCRNSFMFVLISVLFQEMLMYQNFHHQINTNLNEVKWGTIGYRWQMGINIIVIIITLRHLHTFRTINFSAKKNMLQLSPIRKRIKGLVFVTGQYHESGLRLSICWMHSGSMSKLFHLRKGQLKSFIY